MDSPPNRFNVLKHNWRVGDQREVPAAVLDALRGTDAYDSYDQVYRMDGRRWRVEGRISHADGKSFCLLRCVDE